MEKQIFDGNIFRAFEWRCFIGADRTIKQMDYFFVQVDR